MSRTRGWMGALVIGICVASAAGCADPPSHGSKNPSKPVATARVTSSALTKKITGAKAWRIYEGRTQVVVMGFDAKGKPVDGIRFRFASKNSKRKWAASFESLRDGGVIQIGKDGKPTKQTMSDDGVKTLVGASRVLDAWMKKRRGGGVAPKAFMSVATTAAECGSAAVGAVGDCAGLVAECASWGYAGWKRGRWLGAAGGALACLAYNYSQTAQCAGSAYGAGQTCYDAYQNQSSSEENKNGEPNASSNPNEPANPTGSDDPSAPSNPSEPSNPTGSENPEESSTDPAGGSEGSDYTGEDASSWQSEESNAEAEAAAEDPEAPLDEQVEESDDSSYESESADESYDSNPSDPEEEAISDESSESADYSEPEEQASSDDSSSYEESSDDVETEALPTVQGKARHGACGTSRVLQCGTRPATAFCRCVK